MSDLDDALKRVRAAAKKLAAAETQQAAAKQERDAALHDAQRARASWDEMMQASGISRPTLAKALRGA
jgi:DNA-binding protein H-NS